MKKVLGYLVFLSILLISFNVKALEVSKDTLTLKPGESDTVELYANLDTEVTSINFTFVYTSFDVPSRFTVAAGLTDNATNTAHSITFSEPKSGHVLLGTITTNVVAEPNAKSGTTRISGATAKDSEGNTINLTGVSIQTTIDFPEPTPEEIAAKEAEEKARKEAEEKARAEAEAKAKAEAEEKARKEAEEKAKIEAEMDSETPVIDTNLLSSIESNIVNIELRPNVYNYSVTINKDIETLDLKGIAKTPDTEVTISNQKISELENNEIIIKAITSDAEQNYIIKVNIKEDNITTEVKKDSSYKMKWIALSVLLTISLGISLMLLKNK